MAVLDQATDCTLSLPTAVIRKRVLMRHRKMIHMDFIWIIFVCIDSRRYGLATERSKRGKCCMCTWIMSLSTV